MISPSSTIENGIEKREFPRLDKCLPINIRVSCSPDAENRILHTQDYTTFSRNVSQKGIFIVTDNLDETKKEFLHICQSNQNNINLSIYLPEWKTSLKGVAQPIWSKTDNPVDKQRGVGMRFTQMSDDDENKLRLYISAEFRRRDDNQRGYQSIRIESSVVVKKNSEEIYELLKHMERFPLFMKDVKNVTVLEKTANRTVLEWKVEIDGAPVTWKQQNIYDDKNMRVRFKMIEGDFGGYEGEWTLTQLLTGTCIHLNTYINWGIPVLERYIGPVLEDKARTAVEGMLKAIKKKSWVKSASKSSKFAFIIHPLDISLVPFSFGEQSLLTKNTILVEKTFEWLPPFQCSYITGIRSLTRKTVDGELIYCPLLPDQILNLDDDFVLRKVIEAGKIAKDAGAKIIGLGAYVAEVGKKGVTVAESLGIPVTTGSNYTIAISVEGILKAARKVGIEISKARVTIIGATGRIGSICSQLLAEKAFSLTLVARAKSRLEKLANRIRKNSNALVECSTNINPSISNTDIVVTVTSTPSAIIDINLLKSGTVVYDISQPRNITEKDANMRDDILVVDGGLVRPPGNMNFNFYVALPPGLIYACMAETMILALEERYECYSIGGNLEISKVKEISQLGKKHGFKLAELTSFGRKVSNERIKKVRDSFLRTKSLII